MNPRLMGLSFYKPAHRDKQSLNRSGRSIKNTQDKQHNLRLCNDYNKEKNCRNQGRKRFSLTKVYIFKTPVLYSAYHQIGKEISHNEDYYGSYLFTHLKYVVIKYYCSDNKSCCCRNRQTHKVFIIRYSSPDIKSRQPHGTANNKKKHRKPSYLTVSIQCPCINKKPGGYTERNKI